VTDWLKALEKSGLDDVQSASDALQVRGWLDTGTYALNWAVSGWLRGGYPLGKTVEIMGDPATGKSSLVARAIAAAQEVGGVALLDDTEGGYSLEWLAQLGVDSDALALRSSRTVKEHLQAATGFVAAYRAMADTLDWAPGVLALDSIAQLSTDHELETRLDKRDMTKAAEMKAFFRIMGGEFNDLPVLHLGANHTIAAIGNMFQKRTTPGGGGPKFSASVRIDLRAVSKIKAGADYAGVIVTAVIEKNRATAPWKKVQLALPFEGPPSRASGLIPLLVSLDILQERGQFLYMGGEKVGRAHKSKEKFLRQDEAAEQLLEEYPTLLDEAESMLERKRVAGISAAYDEEDVGEEEVDTRSTDG
jgi:recombination protein RecA